MAISGRIKGDKLKGQNRLLVEVIKEANRDTVLAGNGPDKGQ